MLYRLYIGSNNDTKELELDKIKQIVSRFYEGFTVILATGYWRGNEEKTAIVEISIVGSGAEPIIAVLKKELNQQSIAYQTLPKLSFY